MDLDERLELLEPLAEYIAGIPQAALCGMLKENFPNQEYTEELVYLISQRPDFLTVLENLTGCAHLRQRAPVQRLNHEETGDAQRAVFIIKLLEKVTDFQSLDQERLVQLAAELYIASYGHLNDSERFINVNDESQGNFISKYPAGPIGFDNFFSTLPREIWQAAMQIVLEQKNIAPIIKVEALRVC